LLRIGRRNLREVKQLLLEGSAYKAIPRLFWVHHQPLRVIFEEAFSFATYPWRLSLRTPTGDVRVSLYSGADLSTANLVFCRQDYYLPPGARTVVDIGSNIGLSSLYWLTRNPEVYVYCYEPAPPSYGRLLDNLAPFQGRFTPHQAAVSDFRGVADFGMEPSGVNSSLDMRKRAVEFVKVEVVHVNDVMEEVLSHHGSIDMLKLDNEGHEFRTLSAIAPEFWPRIRCVNVGCHGNAAAVPKDFRKTQVGSAERFIRATPGGSTDRPVGTGGRRT
jgi:FkbM family methyltransferase